MKKNKGFTLIELLISIVIAFIFFAIMINSCVAWRYHTNENSQQVEIITQEEEQQQSIEIKKKEAEKLADPHMKNEEGDKNKL